MDTIELRAPIRGLPQCARPTGEDDWRGERTPPAEGSGSSRDLRGGATWRRGTAGADAAPRRGLVASDRPSGSRRKADRGSARDRVRTRPAGGSTVARSRRQCDDLSVRSAGPPKAADAPSRDQSPASLAPASAAQIASGEVAQPRGTDANAAAPPAVCTDWRAERGIPYELRCDTDPEVR